VVIDDNIKAVINDLDIEEDEECEVLFERKSLNFEIPKSMKVDEYSTLQATP
jgi:hypothetical protein